MTTGLPALRALVIYGICVPLAVMLGYLLANPLDMGSLVWIVGLFGVLATPLLLRWHHLLLVFSWNSTALVFFLPGRPALWLVMGAVSLGISVLQHTLVRRQGFLHAPAVARPLLFLVAVVLLTAKFTGGIGFRTAGSENYGGIKYLTLLGAIMAYFALTARRIPMHRANFYCGLFFLGALTSPISNLVGHVNPAFNFIFWIFPPNFIPGENVAGSEGITRIGGLVQAALAMVAVLLCRYGLRGILLSGKPWRLAVLIGAVGAGLFGGHRVLVVIILLTLAIQFYLEGLFKSKVLPIVILGAILGAVVLIPNTTRLPRSFQRALAVLPVDIDPTVLADAEATSKWRQDMWREVLPEVPRYLLLGKGYAINAADYQRENILDKTSGYSKYIMSGTYHNGPLSVLMPFGIWGAIAFLWLLYGGTRLLYLNYRFGEPALRNINTFLLAYFLGNIVLFFFVFGALDVDACKLAGLLGMSVALNGGMAKPVRVVHVIAKPLPIRSQLKLRPAPSLSGDVA